MWLADGKIIGGIPYSCTLVEIEKSWQAKNTRRKVYLDWKWTCRNKKGKTANYFKLL